MFISVTKEGLALVQYLTLGKVGVENCYYFGGVSASVPLSLVAVGEMPANWQIWEMRTGTEMGRQHFCHSSHFGKKIAVLTLTRRVDTAKLYSNVRLVELHDQIRSLTK